MSENFLDGTGAKPISWWMLEEAASPALDGNTTNANDLAWSTPSTRSSDHMQGSFSISIADNAGTEPRREYANLSANFPFKAATTEFTLGGWAKLPAAADAVMANQIQGWFFAVGAGNVAANKLGFRAQPGATIQSDAATYGTAQWVHIVGRWNGNNTAGAGGDDEVSFWINGAKQASTVTLASVTLATTSPFQLSASDGTYLYDEWFIFNVALLDTQIADIFNFGLAGAVNNNLTYLMRRRRNS